MTDDDNTAKEGQDTPRPLIIRILLNVLIGLIVFFTSPSIVPCVANPPKIILSITFLLLMQLLLPIIVNVQTVLGITFAKETISSFLNIPLPSRFILAACLIFSILSAILVYIPNPAFRIKEIAPILTEFKVTDHGLNDGAKSFRSGEMIDISHSTITVKAIFDDNVNDCTWSAKKGTVAYDPVKCSAEYTSSKKGGIDTLTVTVNSTCQIVETSFILIISSKSTQ